MIAFSNKINIDLIIQIKHKINLSICTFLILKELLLQPFDNFLDTFLIYFWWLDKDLGFSIQLKCPITKNKINLIFQ